MASGCCKTTWEKIPEDEPVFILRGQDLLILDRVADWIADAVQQGVNSEKVQRAREHFNAIRMFQLEHPERCKLPD